jgi:hypothetical protein
MSLFCEADVKERSRAIGEKDAEIERLKQEYERRFKMSDEQPKTGNQQPAKLPPLPIPRQIHKDLAWLKKKFLDSDGNPKPGTDKETYEFIMNLEKDLEQEKADRGLIKTSLDSLLAKHPELASKLLEALEAGRFLVTVTFQKKYSPDDPNDLHHYFCRRQFLKNDVVPSLKHIVDDFRAKEMPNAEIEGSDWH